MIASKAHWPLNIIYYFYLLSKKERNLRTTATILPLSSVA